MPHIPLIDADQAPAASAPLLRQVGQAMGTVPAMFRVLAHSPAALRSMWGASAALAGGRLGNLAELVAVAVAERNGCAYCVAVHHALGRHAGLDADALAAAQRGTAADPRAAAALRFALAVVDRRGHVGADAVAAVRAAGFDEGEVVEIVAHVAHQLFTNYVNTVFDVPLDFPPVPLLRPAPTTRTRDRRRHGAPSLESAVT